MPKASMSAPSQRDWDRNAYHVRKGVVLMFRIHLQITSRALSSGGDAACLPARPHRKKKRQRAAALVEAARSLALETGVASVTLTAVANRAGVHYSAVRRHFTSHKEVLLHLAAEGWFRWSNTVCAALREPGPMSPSRVAETLVNGLAADSLFCDLLANFTCTSSTRWISKGLSRSSGSVLLP
jgi:Bacterial regulatory proteins, tetR family